MNDESLDLFRSAHESFQSTDFDQARMLIEEYRAQVDYDQLLWSDKRPATESVDVSVVVVAYEADTNLDRCIESVLSQIDERAELIVVDNGHTVPQHEALSMLPLLLIRTPINLYPSEGRNVGAHFAKGKLIVFLDDDATLGADYIANVRRAWDLFDFTAIRGRVLPSSATSNNAFVGHYDLGHYPIPAVLMTEGNMAILAERFRALRGFDPLLFGAEGTELTYRCLRDFPLKAVFYWPAMLIYHDFASGSSLAAKKARHRLARRYLSHISPQANRLQRDYARWHKRHPSRHFSDDRSHREKLAAYITERRLAIKSFVRNSEPPGE